MANSTASIRISGSNRQCNRISIWFCELIFSPLLVPLNLSSEVQATISITGTTNQQTDEKTKAEGHYVSAYKYTTWKKNIRYKMPGWCSREKTNKQDGD